MNENSVLRTALENERDRLLRELATQETAEANGGQREGRSYATHHSADDASETYDQERALALARHLRGVLGQVEAALHKLDKGAYGRCEGCGQPIERDRLTALPYAALCLQCQAKREGQR